MDGYVLTSDFAKSPLAEGRELKLCLTPRRKREQRSPLAEGRELKLAS